MISHAGMACSTLLKQFHPLRPPKIRIQKLMRPIAVTGVGFAVLSFRSRQSNAATPASLAVAPANALLVVLPVDVLFWTLYEP